METTQQAPLSPTERQANINQMINAWKDRKKQLEQASRQQITTPEYQAALEELDKRRSANGSRTIAV